MVGDGDYKIALVKFDSEGTEIWNRTWGGIDGEVGTDVAVDSYNDVVVSGINNYVVNIQIDEGHPGPGPIDPILIRIIIILPSVGTVALIIVLYVLMKKRKILSEIPQ